MDGSRTTEENLVENTDGNRRRGKPKVGVDIHGDHIEGGYRKTAANHRMEMGNENLEEKRH
jgi:hypothetical protein